MRQKFFTIEDETDNKVLPHPNHQNTDTAISNITQLINYMCQNASEWELEITREYLNDKLLGALDQKKTTRNVIPFWKPIK